MKPLHIRVGRVLWLPLLFTIISGIFLGWISRYSKPLRLTQTEVSFLLESFSSSVLKSNVNLEVRSIRLPNAGDPFTVVKCSTQYDKADSTWRASLLEKDWEANESSYSIFSREFLIRLHRGSIIGLFGRIALSGAGFLFSLLLPTGLSLRRKRKLHAALIGKTPKETPRAILVHRIMGVPVGIWLWITAVTGSLLNFSQDLVAKFDPLPPVQVENREPYAPQSQVELLTAVKSGLSKIRLPESSHLESIHFNTPKAPLVLFYLDDSTRIYFNAQTGKTHKTTGPTTSWVHFLYPLHSGLIVGQKFQPVYIVAMGALALLLSLSGLILILKKRKIKPNEYLIQTDHSAKSLLTFH